LQSFEFEFSLDAAGHAAGAAGGVMKKRMIKTPMMERMYRK